MSRASGTDGTVSAVARIPLLEPEDMSAEQALVYREIVTGPRGQLVGPLRAALHSPALASIWSKFGEYLRYNTCLPPRLSELAILVTGRRWTSQIEWWVHARIGLEAGLPEAVVHAIARLESPVFNEIADFEVYEFARLLQETGQVPTDRYDCIKQRWETRGVVELTALIGYYTMVSMTLNAHQIPIPGGLVALPPVDTLMGLPAAVLQASE